MPQVSSIVSEGSTIFTDFVYVVNDLQGVAWCKAKSLYHSANGAGLAQQDAVEEEGLLVDELLQVGQVHVILLLWLQL